MTRAQRCYEFLCAKGFEYLAVEIGWNGDADAFGDDMAMTRPERALSRDEALVMVQVWTLAYEGTPEGEEFRDEQSSAHLLSTLVRPSPRCGAPLFPTLIEVVARAA